MTDPDRSPPKAPPLSLPLAAASAFNAPVPLPHPDSEEFLRNDRHRTAQELGPVNNNHASASRSNAGLLEPSTHSKESACSSTILESLRRRPSQTTTATDVPGPEEQQLYLRRQKVWWFHGLVGFWKRHVSVTIDEGAHRDHLALERTFLGYLRTSLALAMTGVITAQLFRLQHSISPNPTIGYFILGMPLAASFMVSGMVVLLIGAYRFWRQQGAMIRGKVYTGGWEITGIMVLSILVSGLLFCYLCLS
ncbi:hypothetical protein N0V90_012176 [Kalmusia sp. IMI 367209]|nr:hypothetical protein N0V90_012176 [Kalmusia sp. IMI 367209]